MWSSLQKSIENILKKPRQLWFPYLKHLLYDFLTSNTYPGATYTGTWPRDAAFILDSWLILGEYERGLQECKRIWNNRIVPSSIIVTGRSSNTFVPSRVADRRFKEEYKNLLPTTILSKCGEVYGERPDIDSTALMVRTTCEYLKALGSEKILKEMLPILESSMMTLQKFDEDGDLILEQGPNEDWMDTAYRTGKILYSNLCWLSALKALSELNDKKEYWYELYNYTLKSVIKVFRLDSDSPIGVVGSRIFRYHLWQDMIMLYEHKRISGEFIRKLANRLNSKLGPRVVYPRLPYSNWRSRKWGHYHNGGFWPWFSSVYALALWKHGYTEEAWKVMEKVIRFCLYEWVEPTKGDAKGPSPFRTGCASMLSSLANFREDSK